MEYCIYEHSCAVLYISDLPVLSAATSTSRSETFSFLHYQRWLSTDDERAKITGTRSLSDAKTKSQTYVPQWIEKHRMRKNSLKKSILYKKKSQKEARQICRQFDTHFGGKTRRIWSIISNEGFGIVSKSPLRQTRNGQFGLTLQRWCIQGGVGLDLKDRTIVICKYT